MAFAAATFLLVFAIVEGIARVIWSGMEREVLAQVAKGGEDVLRNDSIHFLKQPSAIYGYVLRPGEYSGGLVVNAQGFFQREPVHLERAAGTLRVVALGESTTMGHEVDRGNFPVHLRALLAASAEGYAATEVINAGVAGWISDQAALRVEHELAAFRPDVVVLYLGWNDFQSYDPYRAPPVESYFDHLYGHSALYPFEWLKSVALLRAWRERAELEQRQQAPPPTPAEGGTSDPADNYRFLTASLDRIVAAFRRENPDVVIALATLASRWPDGTREAFDAPNGHVWWMKVWGLGPEEGAAALGRFNRFLREYADRNGLVLVDVEASFAGLDRGQLFWDFAHMHPDGYELLAGTVYESLRAAGAVRGRPAERKTELSERYRRKSP